MYACRMMLSRPTSWESNHTNILFKKNKRKQNKQQNNNKRINHHLYKCIYEAEEREREREGKNLCGPSSRLTHLKSLS